MANTAKHPDALAWEEWLASEQGVKCTDGSAVGEYLRNRLWWAFRAGVDHGRADTEKKMRGDQIVKEFVERTDQAEDQK